MSPTAAVPFSLSDTLHAAERYVPRALVSPESLASLVRICDAIPAGLTSRLYFECRLAAHDPRVDLIVCVDRETRTLLTAPTPGSLVDDCLTHPIWQAVGRVCAAWGRDASWFFDRVVDIWLEFDADDLSASPAPLPSVFVGFEKTSDWTSDQIWQAARESAALLRDRPMSPSMTARVRQAIDARPAGVTMPYVGVMCPRDMGAVRLCFMPLAGDRLRAFLRSAGWPGAPDDVLAVLDALRDRHDRPASAAVTLVHLDIGDDVHERLGMEITFERRPQLHGTIADVDRDLLDASVAAGFCTREKADALVAWPGHSMEQYAHTLWPTVAIRRISHLKLVCRPGEPPEMKAYLSLFHGLVHRV